MIAEETVAEVHALLLAAWVDRYNAGVDDYNDADDLILLLKHSARYQRNDIGRLVLTGVELHHRHQQIAPRKHRTGTHVPL